LSDSKAAPATLREPTWWHGPVAFLARALLRALWATYRLEVLDPDRLRNVSTAQRPAIYLAWHHQAFLAATLIIKELIRLPRRLTVMISQSRDGDLVTRVAEPFGIRVYRGSATRGGQRALRGLYRELARMDSSILMLPDGPQGPPLVVKPGGVVLAQTAGAPILPLGMAAGRATRLGSWDRLVLPLPFSRVVVAVGEPRSVPRQLEKEQRDQICLELETELETLSERARAALGADTD
jgi:lysophospholipid acyltransferase (LPLAT)-like uncharacterized protein